MIIGQFCDAFPPNIDGVGRVALSYCETLQDAGHRAIYVAPVAHNYDFSEAPCEVLGYYGSKIPGESYRIGIPLADYRYFQKARKISFDIVHAHSPFVAGKEAIRIARKHNLPLVATFHSKYYDDFLIKTKSPFLARLGVRIIVRTLNQFDEVWTVNNATSDVLRSYGYNGNIVIMPNGTDPHEATDEDRRAVSEQFPIRDDVPKLLFVGQQNYKKNIRGILEACAMLLRQNTKFQLIMVGRGPDEKLIRSEAAKLGFRENIDIVFTGFIGDRNLLMALYERCDLLVFPSIYDNAPMVVREAAVMGTPALVVTGSCASEGITHNQNGFLCASPDAPQIAHGILEALPLTDSVGAEAKRTIPIRWSEIIDSALDRYKYLIEKKNAEHKV